MNNMNSHLLTGGQNDDCRRYDFCHMLASVSHILHRHVAYAGVDHSAVHTRCLFGVLLAGYVQFDAQPHCVLLDELQVNLIAYLSSI